MTLRVARLFRLLSILDIEAEKIAAIINPDIPIGKFWTTNQGTMPSVIRTGFSSSGRA